MKQQPITPETFTRAQWVEIYNAVGRDIQNRMPTDSNIEHRGISAGYVRKLERHWGGIYHAIWHKLNPWLYDPRWRAEMVEILGILSDHGYASCENCGLPEGHVTAVHNVGWEYQKKYIGKPVTMHRTTCFCNSGGDQYRRYCMICLDDTRRNWNRVGQPIGKRKRVAA